jgi:cytochrome c-type protein NapB
MKKSVAIFSSLVVVGLASFLMGAKADATVGEDTLGLSKVSVNADSGLKTEPFKYGGNGPGDHNKRIPRAYDNAPPMIPHDISSFGEITQENNACIGCHMPEAAKAVGAIAVPKTHLTNLRKGNGEDLKGELWNGRYNCTQCHAPQAVLDPVVMNRFKGAFKAKTGGEYKTNLINTIREGVIEDKSGSFDINKEVVAD